MKILIIDDEVPVADLLASAVEAQGHESAVAHDGEEGLARLADYGPDAVFLDILMPGMSGIEVLRRIRTSHPVLPVVMITGYAYAPELNEASQLGVTEVIEKPFILKQLGGALAGLEGGPDS